MRLKHHARWIRTFFVMASLMAALFPIAVPGARAGGEDGDLMVSNLREGQEVIIFYAAGKNAYQPSVAVHFFVKRKGERILCMAVSNEKLANGNNRLLSVFWLTEKDVAGLDALLRWYASSGCHRSDADDKLEEHVAVVSKFSQYERHYWRRNDGIETQVGVLPLGELVLRVTHSEREVDRNEW